MSLAFKIEVALIIIMCYNAQVTRGIHTGNLESIHSLYNKYVTKRKKYSHAGMKARLQLAALDHNTNANLPQATTKAGELRYSLRYSKAAKTYVTAPVKHAKNTNYRKEILHGISHSCADGM